MSERIWTGANWELRQGDCVEEIALLPNDSIDLSVFSPPFQNLYTYSASERDLGNSRNQDEFFEHFGYVTSGLFNATKPGRLSCCHIAQYVSTKVHHGVIGLIDLRGAMIRAFVNDGWVYHGEVCIDKDPQCIPDGTPVLTPDGWKSVESLVIGDSVIGRDGQATRITDIPYHGEQPLLRVTFDDGGYLDCGPEHQWTVRTSAVNPWRTMRTDELIIDGIRTPSGRMRFEIPMVEPVEFEETFPLPLAPRLLGALLADGGLTTRGTVSITKDKALVESLPLPDGHQVVPRPGTERAGGRTQTYTIKSDQWHENEVLFALRDLGLIGCRAWEKFIPACYLKASVSARRQLLRGLMDGDGRINPRGSLWYRTTSESLANNVVELVQSLGGLATAHKRKGNYYSHGDKQGRPLWEVSIRLSGDWCPFTLQRKARYWSDTRRHVMRHIRFIEPLGIVAPCTCISVEADDGLFVAKDFIVTHNSQAIRTHSKALLFVQLRKDSSWLRPALADYILVFRKPGENQMPISPDLSNDEWIEWARPIWYGIDETDTLNTAVAKENDDERHICPLQLGTIERCIRLWSNRGDLVLSPFAGIGSEGYEAIRLGRRYLGIELKQSYATTAAKNLALADTLAHQGSLFPAETTQE